MVCGSGGYAAVPGRAYAIKHNPLFGLVTIMTFRHHPCLTPRHMETDRKAGG